MLTLPRSWLFPSSRHAVIIARDKKLPMIYNATDDPEHAHDPILPGVEWTKMAKGSTVYG